MMLPIALVSNLSAIYLLFEYTYIKPLVHPSNIYVMEEWHKRLCQNMFTFSLRSNLQFCKFTIYFNGKFPNFENFATLDGSICFIGFIFFSLKQEQRAKRP